MAESIRLLNETLLAARRFKLTRSQHILFLIADMMAWAEVGAAVCRKAAHREGKDGSHEYLNAVARLFAIEVAEKVSINGQKIATGCGQVMSELKEKLHNLNSEAVMSGYLKDMDLVAEELVTNR